MDRIPHYVIGEIDFWKSVVLGLTASKITVRPYLPRRRELPPRVLDVPTAWKGIESILGDLIRTFNLETRRCLEFGVEFGYSTAALSCFFEHVRGIDKFVGDKHTVEHQDIYRDTVDRLSPYQNIELVRCDYRDWIATDDSSYDLIHVDIVHTYADTLQCGLWSAQHAPCVLFHDTRSFPTVKQAVVDVARQTGKQFYQFKESNGLGILID